MFRYRKSLEGQAVSAKRATMRNRINRRLALEPLENRQLLAEMAQVRLQATDLNGQPVTALLQGQEYLLSALVKDIRGTPHGVFSAYFDLSINDNNLISVVDQAGGIGGVLFSPFYVDGRAATNSVESPSQEIGEVGAFTQEKYFGDEKLLFQMRFSADSQGTLQFGTNPAEDFGKVFSLRQQGTLQNSEVSFGSLSLNIVSAASLVNDFATVLEDANATTINVLNNDPGGSAAWTIQSISEVSAGGTVTIASNGKSLTYRPAADFFGTETFKYLAVDGSGIPGEATVTVTVNPVNDAPRNQFPPADRRVFDEDTTFTFSNSNGRRIGIWDDGVAPATTRLNLFALDGGTLNLPNLQTLISQGKIFLEGGANGTPSMQIRGLTADVNAALEDMQFTPKSNFFTVAPTQVARIRMWTREVGGPAPLLQADNTFEMTVNSVNDAPVNVVPGAQVADSATRVVTFDASKRISVSDVDLGAATMRVTLTVNSGALTLGSTSGISFNSGGNNSAAMTFTGTAANVNNALLNLKYTGNVGTTSDTLTVLTSDLGNSGSGGVLTDQDTVAITIQPANQAPVNSVPGPQTFNATTRTVTFDASRPISVSDPDAGSANLRVTLFVNRGILTLPTVDGLTFRNGANGTRYLLFDGTQTAINNALTNLVYTANPGESSDVLTIDTNDLGNTGAGGSKVDRDTISLTLSGGVNQAPVNSVPGAQTFTTSNRNVTFDSSKRISISDPDAGSANVRVTLFVNRGILTLPTIAGLSFINGGNGTRYMLFDGTVSAVNNALLNLVYTANSGETSDVLTIDTNDLGNTGAGGSKVDRDSISLTLAGSANQAPVITVPGAQQYTSSGRTVTFDSAKRISINDPDVGTKNLRVTLFVNGGVLKLGSLSGLTFVGGADNTRYMLFDGTQSAVNNALLNLRFTANSGVNADLLTVDVHDLGNTGSGGAKTDRKTVSLTVQGFGTSGRSGGSGSGEAGSRNSFAVSSLAGATQTADEVFSQPTLPPVSIGASAARLADLLASTNSGRAKVESATDAIFGENA
jgi:hypothetical protein